MVYRAYRIPYAWIPQLAQPQETPIAAVDVRTLRQPGAAAAGPAQSVVRVAGVQPYSKAPMRCASQPITILCAAVRAVPRCGKRIPADKRGE